uniref:Uncharacterized protein n=1 Tax=Anguilla anguilla TaxID=7936 RepID=A0A0E9PCP1_ANGAN
MSGTETELQKYKNRFYSVVIDSSSRLTRGDWLRK